MTTASVSPVPMAPSHPTIRVGHKAPEMIAMVHVHSTTAILNHGYTALLDIDAPSPSDITAINKALKVFSQAANALTTEYPILAQVAPPNTMLRSSIFLPGFGTNNTEVTLHLDKIASLPFVKALIDRALSEVDIYVNNGIKCVEVENVAAPYFIGAGNCPWEELAVLFLATKAIRTKYPQLLIGMHVLSANELEVLPLAIACGAYFVRSEATLFHGIRPEGETNNNSNMARFLYVRQVLRNLVSVSPTLTFPVELRQDQYPQIWSDVKKKHTVFFEELKNIEEWLHNINFMKLEGVIVTGAETGSDVDEESLKKARMAVDGFKLFNKRQFVSVANRLKEEHMATATNNENQDLSQVEYYLPHLPVVTGSGMNFKMYRNYADYCIVGTALKHGSYWENAVSEENVKRVVEEFKAFMSEN